MYHTHPKMWDPNIKFIKKSARWESVGQVYQTLETQHASVVGILDMEEIKQQYIILYLLQQRFVNAAEDAADSTESLSSLNMGKKDSQDNNRKFIAEKRTV